MKILTFFGLILVVVAITIGLKIMPIQANSPDNSQPIVELKENRKLWRSQRFKTYQFTYQQQCFCVPPANTPLKVSVKNGKITQVINLNTNQSITDLDFPNNIDQLFEIIETAIKENADEILVNYDATLGYPTRIAIDYQTMLADDEVTYLAENLVKLE